MKHLSFYALAALLLSACIGDDIINDRVEEVVRIINPVDSITVGDTANFVAMYFDNVGREASAEFAWASSDQGVLAVSSDGQAIGLTEGNAVVSVELESKDKGTIFDEFDVVVTQAEVLGLMSRSGTIRTTTFYTLEGSFTLTDNGDGKLTLAFEEDYKASANLPGLYLYLTNNPNTLDGALEIGEVEVFEGAHSYEIEDVELNAYSHLLYYCKPFVVKVGDGEIGGE